MLFCICVHYSFIPSLWDRPGPEFNLETRTLVVTGFVRLSAVLTVPTATFMRPSFTQLVKRKREPGKHERMAKKA